MKTVGIIGGIGPESTIDYYRLIIASWRKQVEDESYPSIVINSIDRNRIQNALVANKLSELTEFLLTELHRLANAGVDFAVLAANAAHIVFDALREKSPIPLISIIDGACDDARSRGLKRAGLFGTKFVMQGNFYLDKFKQAGIDLIVPTLYEQEYIHDKYFGELVNGIFEKQTRDRFLAIAERLKVEEGIEGLILGATELPLLLRDASNEIPFLDTTMIHVKQIVTAMLPE